MSQSVQKHIQAYGTLLHLCSYSVAWSHSVRPRSISQRQVFQCCNLYKPTAVYCTLFWLLPHRAAPFAPAPLPFDLYKTRSLCVNVQLLSHVHSSLQMTATKHTIHYTEPFLLEGSTQLVLSLEEVKAWATWKQTDNLKNKQSSHTL